MASDTKVEARGENQWITPEVRASLEERGWAVVPEVLPDEDCTRLRQGVHDYVTSLYPGDKWPTSSLSLIQSQSIGHIAPAWEVRKEVTKVFSELWSTEKLLTSFDAVAVGKPPEEGKSSFGEEGENWLHCDQGPRRKGLHCYQSGVYLETCDEEDWVFRVLEGSNKLHQEFFKENPGAVLEANIMEYYELTAREVTWYTSRGCRLRRIAVPRGGMVLWDSRTIHDNIPPTYGRPHPRWRYAVFVAMAPAAWARPRDLEVKREAYRDLLLTTHWPSQDVNLFRGSNANAPGGLTDLPEAARGDQVKKLVGLEPYDFDDGRPNGPPEPAWDGPLRGEKLISQCLP